ncbi:MAG: YhjD/YihY/BrkB family envelope integrity protein [Candidatus Paceibacterota bacterium]
MKVISHIKNRMARAVGIFNFFKVGEKSAALAYYALFALSPLLVLVTSLVSLTFFGSYAESGIERFFVQYFGPQSAILFDRVVVGLRDQTVNAWVAVVGFLIILYASVRFFRAIQNSLLELFSVSLRDKNVVKNYVRIYFYSFVYLVVFLLFISLLFASQFFLTIGIGLIEELFAYSLSAFLIRVLTSVVILILLTGFLGITYRLLSKFTVGWTDAFIGGFAGSILMLVLNKLLGFYFSFSESLVVYGAAGFLVAILLWIYLFFVILFSGALIARYASKM